MFCATRVARVLRHPLRRVRSLPSCSPAPASSTLWRLQITSSTLPSFASTEEYNEYLATYHARLPSGFRVGTHSFTFRPEEMPTQETPLYRSSPHAAMATAFRPCWSTRPVAKYVQNAKMTLTIIAADEPTTSFGQPSLARPEQSPPEQR